jgi:peptidoglycan/xylan/chitin deacetylase (PgdA/CDA1 family)
MPSKDKSIYLTFDDGPIPEVTEFVLEILEKYNAKATFFCIGDNIRKNPNIFKAIINQGHTIGNHTFNHLNGWKTNDEMYGQNIKKCQEIIEQNQYFSNSEKPLFRPPYGRIKRSQSFDILPHYQVVMWDVLSGDFSLNLSKEQVFTKTIRHTEAGSIVLFHDSIKAYSKMSYALPKFLEHFSEKDFQFLAL